MVDFERAALNNGYNYNSDFIHLDKRGIDSLQGIHKFTNATEIWLDQNNISDLEGISNLQNLVFLDLSSNEIKDISPLSELDNLHELLLDCNKISDIAPLRRLKKLIWLDLRANEINDIDFDTAYDIITNIDYNLLLIEGNPVEEKFENMKMIINAFKDKETKENIRYYYYNDYEKIRNASILKDINI